MIDSLTQEQRFGRVKAGYASIEKPKKPVNGDLLLYGRVYESNKPFPLLQSLRTKLIREGHPKNKIKITYTKSK